VIAGWPHPGPPYPGSWTIWLVGVRSWLAGVRFGQYVTVDADHDQLRRQILAEFLRSRRARIDPQAAGIVHGSRRRVPGLRREEVAALANVGTSWYTWLEQARDVRASAHVISAIAGALRLDVHERRHLFALAETEDPERPGRVTPVDLQGLVDGFGDAPAYVINARFDVLAHNWWAAAFLGDIGPAGGRIRNLMELAFTDPSWRRLIMDWDQEAARHVALYRAALATHLDDPVWTSLPERLRAASPEFGEIWDRHDVAGPGQRTKRYHHPALGDVTLESTTLVVADAPELRVMLLRPTDTPTARRFARFAAANKIG
jgi:transcriptional regulator with XRE-family HTH domain